MRDVRTVFFGIAALGMLLLGLSQLPDRLSAMGQSLVGGLMATLGVFAANRHEGRMAKIRWEQEQRTRFNRDRLTLYTRFLNLADEVEQSSDDPSALERIQKKMKRLETTIELLASSNETLDRASVLLAAALSVKLSSGPDAHTDLQKAVVDFQLAAVDELGHAPKD